MCVISSLSSFPWQRLHDPYIQFSTILLSHNSDSLSISVSSEVLQVNIKGMWFEFGRNVLGVQAFPFFPQCHQRCAPGRPGNLQHALTSILPATSSQHPYLHKVSIHRCTTLVSNPCSIPKLFSIKPSHLFHAVLSEDSIIPASSSLHDGIRITLKFKLSSLPLHTCDHPVYGSVVHDHSSPDPEHACIRTHATEMVYKPQVMWCTPPGQRITQQFSLTPADSSPLVVPVT